MGGKIDFALQYEEIISQYSPEEPKVNISEENVVSIGYTSGTTGRPKGAMITHKNFLTEVANSHASVPLSLQDVGLNFFPFFHVGFSRRITYMRWGCPMYARILPPRPPAN